MLNCRRLLGNCLNKIDMELQVILLGKHRFRNLLNINKKNGKLICRNGFVLNFNKANHHNIKDLFYFSLLDGVLLSNKRGHWNYKKGIITTPQEIKFDIKTFDKFIFAETFLYDIHFSDFNLNNKIVIQAGGFTGDTALYYADRGANVYSFEPNPESYNLALLNLNLNPDLARRIIFKNLAIDKDRIIEFYIDKYNSGGSSAYDNGGKKIVNVRSVSINTILSEFNIKDPYLLDIDIKGSEFEIINEDSLSKFKMIRIEYTAKIGNITLGKREAIIKRLKQLGFKNIRIYKHNNGSYDLIEHGTIEAKK